MKGKGDLGKRWLTAKAVIGRENGCSPEENMKSNSIHVTLGNIDNRCSY